MSKNTPILNTEDVIDSRDVIGRIEFLEGCEVLDDEEAAELEALRSLQDECQHVADWKYGETLVRDSYFEDYARELAEDIGAYDPNAGWPLGCIDWEKAAEQLLIDYTSVEFDGETYWIR